MRSLVKPLLGKQKLLVISRAVAGNGDNCPLGKSIREHFLHRFNTPITIKLKTTELLSNYLYAEIRATTGMFFNDIVPPVSPYLQTLATGGTHCHDK